MFRKNFLLSVIFSFSLFSHLANAQQPTLTVYSYNSFMSQWGPGEAIKKGFEAQCNCQLDVVTLGDGVSVLNRIRLEGDKTNADVILGLDNNLLAQAKQADILIPHQISKPDNLNTDWWDDSFIPYDFGYFAFIYNQDKIKNPPHSLHELVENHTVTVTKGWSEAYGMFLKDEADLVLSYSTSPIAHIINENNHSYAAAIFAEGHYRQVEVAGIIKYSQEVDLARQFLRYLLTPEIQRQFAEKNVMYPIIKTDLPDAYKQINKSREFTPEEIEKHQKGWIREWQSAISN